MRRFLVSSIVGCGLICGSFFAPLIPATAQDATPTMTDCPTTTPEENKEIARRWYAALSGGSVEDVGALAAEDLVYHFPSPQTEPRIINIEDWASERLQDYPDLQVTVEQIVAEGDMVASYHRYQGTQVGDVQRALGHPATGLQTEWISTVFFRFECGKVVELWSLSDELGRLQRVGVISDEELQSVEPVATPAS